MVREIDPRRGDMDFIQARKSGRLSDNADNAAVDLDFLRIPYSPLCPQRHIRQRHQFLSVHKSIARGSELGLIIATQRWTCASQSG